MTISAIYCNALVPTGNFAKVYPNSTTRPDETVMLECNSQVGPPYNKTLFCAFDPINNSYRLQGDSPNCPGTFGNYCEFVE